MCGQGAQGGTLSSQPPLEDPHPPQRFTQRWAQPCPRGASLSQNDRLQNSVLFTGPQRYLGAVGVSDYGGPFAAFKHFETLCYCIILEMR